MRRVYFACLLPCLAATFLLSPATPLPLVNHSAKVVSPLHAPQVEPRNQARILDSYGKLPLSFEANHGQSDGRVKFLSRNGGYMLFLTQDEAVLALRGSNTKTDKANTRAMTNASAAHAPQSGAVASTTGAVLRMKLRNANPAATITGMSELPGTSNYFIGNDPAKWRSNVPTYAKVKYEGIYSGIDLVYYGNQRQLEYDFIVAPGADPRRIAFEVGGAERIRQDEHGELVLKMREGEIRWHKPVVYQEKDGARREIPAHYSITAANRVGFEVGQYDSGRPLCIDPYIYSTYLGGGGVNGTGFDLGSGIAVDSAGNAYVVGYTLSTSFPTKSPLQPASGGNPDAFVAKIDSSGSALVYSTYLGGSDTDNGYGIAVDSAGNAYVTGLTGSGNFPVTPGAFQTVCGGGSCSSFDAFVAELNPTGSALVYSTYLGGSAGKVGNSGYGIAVDSAGNAYVTGYTGSSDFPTKNPLQPTYGGGLYDAFVAELNSTGSALVYSTYLGGSLEEAGNGIAVDSAGNAYVTGDTDSYNFPTMNPLRGYGGSQDAFVTKLSPSGSAFVYSTYHGGTDYDNARGITVDSAGNAYVTGSTASTNFPITPGAFQTVCNGGSGCSGLGDAFVTKLNSSGSALVYSTYLGGSSDEFGAGIAVDSAGNAYVIGETSSTNFPLQSPLQQKLRGQADVFVSRINPAGSALVYSTYLGGSAVDSGRGIAMDSAGNAYVTGYTYSADFPTMNPLQPNYGGAGDAFVTKLFITPASTTTLSSSLNPSIYGQKVTLTATVTSPLGPPPNGETVTFKQGSTVLATGTLNAGSASFSTSTLTVGTKSITAVYPGDATLAGSTSKTLSQVVNKATTTTTLASSLNPSKFGQSVTFTATVTPQFGGTVTGNVTFMDGTTTLGSRTLSSGVAKFTTSTLATGTHTITATYNGSSNFSTSSATLTQTVN